MPTEYVFRNSQQRPDKDGVVRPYLTKEFDGVAYPVCATKPEDVEELSKLGEPELKPDDLIVVGLRQQDTHTLLRRLLSLEEDTSKILRRIAANLDRFETERNRPQPPRLSRWQRFKVWLWLKLRRKLRRNR